MNWESWGICLETQLNSRNLSFHGDRSLWRRRGCSGVEDKISFRMSYFRAWFDNFSLKFHSSKKEFWKKNFNFTDFSCSSKFLKSNFVLFNVEKMSHCKMECCDLSMTNFNPEKNSKIISKLWNHFFCL